MVYWLFGLVEVENGCVRLFVAVVSGEKWVGFGELRRELALCR